MKTKSSVLKSLLIVTGFLLPLNLLAQENIGDLFKSSPQDATKLVDAYMAPVFKGMGQGFNTGWTNTAKAKNFLRFEVRISGSYVMVPDKDKTYNTNTLGLVNVKPADGSNGIGATAFGNDSQTGAKMELYTSGGAKTGQTFDLPKGSGLNFAPGAQLQATVGLVKNIDVTIRYAPPVTISGKLGEINQFGLGAKIELLPLIMGKKEKLLPFDLAVAAGFTNTNYHVDLNVNNGKYDNQKVEVKFKGFSTEALISKKISVLTVFGSLGFNSSKSSLVALGTYDFATGAGDIQFNDPISLKHSDVSAMKGSLGFQLNLAFLRFYGSYTESTYSYFNGGIGVAIGK